MLAEANWQESLVDPTGAVEVRLFEKGGVARYEILHEGSPLIEESPLGLHIGGEDFRFGIAVKGWATGREEGRCRLRHGKVRAVEWEATTGALELENGNGRQLAIEWKVFAEGAAFRYRVGVESGGLVRDEASGFRIPEGARAWLGERSRPGKYDPNGQPRIREWVSGASSGKDGFYFPALFEVDPSTDRWVMLHEAGLGRSYCATHLAAEVEDRLYRISLPNPQEGDLYNHFYPTMAPGETTTWKVVVTGTLAEIVETSLPQILSPAPDTDLFPEGGAWVNPGRAAWSWWSQDVGTPELQRRYIDFAGRHGWEYVLVDSDWVAWPDAEREIQSLVHYAGEREVGLWVWYNSGGSHSDAEGEPRDRLNTRDAMEREFAKLAQWGIRGVKVDYFLSDKQARIHQYIDLMEAAAQHRIMLNFHGATVPRGWRRTYPNLMTVEAVYGGEMYKFEDGPDADHHLGLVFTRGVVGAMDYTPMVFKRAYERQGLRYGHQLALGVLFESAVQHWAGRADGNAASGYGALFPQNPGIAEVLAEVPVRWDATRLLEGHPGSHAVMARRHGSDWWIGAVTGDRAGRTISLDLDPLLRRSGSLTVYESGQDGQSMNRSVGHWQPGGRINLVLRAKDGAVLHYEPYPESSYWETLPGNNGWKFAPGFGWLADGGFPYVFLPPMGWVWFDGNGHRPAWIWCEAEGWGWTGPAYWPWIWDPGEGRWMNVSAGAS